MSTNTGGRPLPAVITNNFTHLEKVDNKSNRYFWKCNFCGNTEGSVGVKIQGQDNNLLKHLTDKCTVAPPDVRREAHTLIVSKTQLVAGLESQATSQSSSQDPSITTLEPIVPIRKRKKQSLDGYIDYPLMKDQSNVANSLLVRYVLQAD